MAERSFLSNIEIIASRAAAAEAPNDGGACADCAIPGDRIRPTNRSELSNSRCSDDFMSSFFLVCSIRHETVHESTLAARHPECAPLLSELETSARRISVRSSNRSFHAKNDPSTSRQHRSEHQHRIYTFRHIAAVQSIFYVFYKYYR